PSSHDHDGRGRRAPPAGRGQRHAAEREASMDIMSMDRGPARGFEQYKGSSCLARADAVRQKCTPEERRPRMVRHAWMLLWIPLIHGCQGNAEVTEDLWAAQAQADCDKLESCWDGYATRYYGSVAACVAREKTSFQVLA